MDAAKKPIINLGKRIQISLIPTQDYFHPVQHWLPRTRQCQRQKHLSVHFESF